MQVYFNFLRLILLDWCVVNLVKEGCNARWNCCFNFVVLDIITAWLLVWVVVFTIGLSCLLDVVTVCFIVGCWFCGTLLCMLLCFVILLLAWWVGFVIWFTCCFLVVMIYLTVLVLKGVGGSIDSTCCYGFCLVCLLVGIAYFWLWVYLIAVFLNVGFYALRGF